MNIWVVAKVQDGGWVGNMMDPCVQFLTVVEDTQSYTWDKIVTHTQVQIKCG